jgi:hypothetical protein
MYEGRGAGTIVEEETPELRIGAEAGVLPLKVPTRSRAKRVSDTPRKRMTSRQPIPPGSSQPNHRGLSFTSFPGASD